MSGWGSGIPVTPAAPKRTEAEMLELLAKRYGPKAEAEAASAPFAFIPHVRNAASWDATRTADALAMGVWKSRGLLLHGFEIKCSRTDWLRELRDAAKAEDGWARYCDRWWLVIADAEIIRDGEVPEPWGILCAKGSILCAKGKALTQVRDASPLQPDALPRTALAALLRSACNNSAARSEVANARMAARDEAERAYKTQVESVHAQMVANRDLLHRFRDVTGITLSDAKWSGRTPEDVGALVKAVLAEEHALLDAERRAHHAISALRHAAQAVLSLADELEVPAKPTQALTGIG